MKSPTQKPALSSAPSIHEKAVVLDCELGAWTEVGAYTEMRQSSMDDYSYLKGREYPDPQAPAPKLPLPMGEVT